MDTSTKNTTNMSIDTNTSTKRPTVVTVAAILLIVLSLVVVGLGLAGQFGLLRVGFGGRQFTAGQFRNRSFNSQGGVPQGGSPQGGFPQGGNPQGGFSQNGSPQNELPNGQNGQTGQGTTRNFTFNRSGGTGLARVFRFLGPVTLALDIILFVIAIVAVIGLFMNKRWGAVLAIIDSALIILLTIPSMIRIFSSVILVENLVRILLSVAIIVLLLLPSARRTSVTAKTGDFEEVERVVR